jgi:hypothetical protein
MAPPTPQDSRLRPFRAAAYAVYLTLVVGFCLLVIVSVVRSVRQMTPPHLPPEASLLTVRECVDRADGLYQELEAGRRSLEEGGAARGAAVRWSDFRVQWLEQLRQLEAQCSPRSRARQVLRPVFDELEKLMNLYTTHAVQFAGELGPTVDRLRLSLERARKDAAAGRF